MSLVPLPLDDRARPTRGREFIMRERKKKKASKEREKINAREQ